MCGIAGILHLKNQPIPDLQHRLAVMNRLQAHRGPDGSGIWVHPHGHVGLAHRRLSIIDLTTGDQPMQGCGDHLTITYNGEIYNYLELRRELGADRFRTTSDTEVILQAWERWGRECLPHLRGMWSFALWDETVATLFCARDRFGIKPFYYTVVGEVLYFASEIKALLPFVPEIRTDPEGLKDYLAFQFCLDGKTLFQGIHELEPGHQLQAGGGGFCSGRYWDVFYEVDYDHTEQYFTERLRALLQDSVDVHLRADVPLGAYLSGGLDSSSVATLAARTADYPLLAFNGKFLEGAAYDESAFAREVARSAGLELHEVPITADDFAAHLPRLLYHLDYPVAGPGSFPQFMTSREAARHRKVLLGGQGGDEIFGGYTRYLIAYFEQVLKAAIDGTLHNGNYIVNYESIFPNLGALRNYKPLLAEFWREGLFESMDRRYFRLINRSATLQHEVRWELLGDYQPFDSFARIFSGANIGGESYFDRMTHFDFKTLLPALLQVEDRVSMAHGLESRVPLLDHPLVELAATMPANFKFGSGTQKQALKSAMAPVLPPLVLNRQDKMGFPVPLVDWLRGPLRSYVDDIFGSSRALQREFIDNGSVLQGLDTEPQFGRKLWGLLCLEVWQQQFHDREPEFKAMLKETA